MIYSADKNRYESGMAYRRCGKSGVLLPAVSLGLWHNFGATAAYEHSREIVRYAFDHGITHLDLANNYGPRMEVRRRHLAASWTTTSGHTATSCS